MAKIKIPFASSKRENTNSHHSSCIGETLFLKGELRGDEDIVVEGKVTGRIDLPNHNLTVGKTGKIEAEISVKSIHVQGEVVGNVHATEKVYIAQKGHIEGDITAPRISITDGAQFKGNVKMAEDGNKALPIEDVTPFYEQNKLKKDSTAASGKASG